jgi:hypothetical protein
MSDFILTRRLKFCFINAIQSFTTVPAAKGAIAMDRREKFGKRRSREETFATHGDYGRADETTADSWFKQRLNHVRNEAKKEPRMKAIRLGRGQ